MADHGTEYATATGNDYDEHERTFATVVKLTKVATAALILVVIGLAIGGVHGAWKLAGLAVVLAIVGGAAGAVMSEKGTVVPLVISAVVVLALFMMFG